MGKQKFTYQEVFDFFKSRNCILLSTEYMGCNFKLEYQCSCGNKTLTTFRIFKNNIKGCKKCSTKRAMETNKKNHNGILHLQSEVFKEERKKVFLSKFGVDSPLKSKEVMDKRINTNLEKYGVEQVSQNKTINIKQREGFIKKYGVSHFTQVETSNDKFKNTLLSKYNVTSLSQLSNCASKESQQLFTKLYDTLSNDLKDKCYFASLNREFVVNYNKTFFKYDFVHSKLKKCIEYNGSRFHPQPFQEDTEVGWCLFNPTKTVKEARNYETIKIEALKERGFSILVIWDYEWKKEPEQTIKKCIDFLYN